MTVSTYRTVTIGSPSAFGGPRYGTMPAGLMGPWPMAQPGDDLDYYVNAEKPLTDVSDSIASVSLSIKPSGTGELQAADLTISGRLIAWWGSGGVAGRPYTVLVDVTTTAGRRFSWPIGLSISSALATGLPPPAPNSGFGTEITWTASMSGLQDSAGDSLTDSAGNSLFGSSGARAGLVDSAGNTLEDSTGNILTES